MLEAYIAASIALVIFGIPGVDPAAALFADRRRTAPRACASTATRVFIVAAILVTAIVVNVVINVRFSDAVRSLSVHRRGGVGRAPARASPLRQPHWSELPGAFKGSIFLLSLVLAASMMPVHKLPDASWQVALGLGFVSAVFDNIPLDGARAEAGRLRLGLRRVCGRLRRIDDLVRLVGRRRAHESVPGREVGVRVAARRVACRTRLCHRICADAAVHGEPDAPYRKLAGTRAVWEACARAKSRKQPHP